MKKRVDQRLYVLFIFAVTFIAEAILIPLGRTQPKIVHEFFHELSPWQKYAATFTFCSALIYLAFSVLAPKRAHLKHDAFPPIWIGVLFATAFIAMLDVHWGLQPGGYRGSPFDWFFYAILPWFLVWSKFALEGQSQFKGAVKPAKLPDLTKDVINKWLTGDALAGCDILDNYPLALILAEMLEGETRSIGIVGPFGSGKSSLINWMREAPKNNQGPRLLYSQHSCWGFESSSSAVHEMLADAVRIVNFEIDTFSVRSLPESYRETFAAGGDWLDAFSNLLLKIPDATQQFQRLSELLKLLNAKMIFVVEDLDRADTSGFEIQEVLGFLQRMRDFEYFGFVLTGGLSSTRKIDFEKLCDHVEVLRPVAPVQAGEMIRVMHAQWRNVEDFPHILRPGMGEEHEWNPSAHVLVSDRELLSFPQAIVRLLSTPRALRHALGRTHSGWQRLKGEVNLDHLIALNALRTGAPDAFLFLVRHWDRFRFDSYRNQKPNAVLKEALSKEWSEQMEKAECDELAAFTVIRFILPRFGSIFDSQSSYPSGRIQELGEKRYWERAVSQRIASHEIRDQRVFREMDDWLVNTSGNSMLIDSLCSSSEFGIVWSQLMRAYPELTAAQIRLACGQIFNRIRAKHGSVSNRDSVGFAVAWRLSNERIPCLAENTAWLKLQIAESATVSLALVNDLLTFWAGKGSSFLLPDERPDVRASTISILKSIGIRVLSQTLSTEHRYALSQLVLDSDATEKAKPVTDEWKWLGSLLLEGVRDSDRALVEPIACLLSSRIMTQGDYQHDEPIVDSEVLDGLFGSDASVVINYLSSNVESVSTDMRSLIARVVVGANQFLSTKNSPE